MAAFLDRPMVLIPARWTAVRIPTGRLKAAALGVTQKTLSNHLSNVRAALAWMQKEKRAPARGAALSPEWQALSDQCPKLPHRAHLLPLMRFCSARAIAPGAVDEAAVDALMEYRRSTTSLAVGRQGAARSGALLERSGPDGRRAGRASFWSSRPRARPKPFRRGKPIRSCLREEIEAYLDSLTRVRKTAKGKRVRPGQADHHQEPPLQSRSGAQDGEPDRRRHGRAELALGLSRSGGQPARARRLLARRRKTAADLRGRPMRALRRHGAQRQLPAAGTA